MTIWQHLTVLVTGTAMQQGTLQVLVTAAHSVTHTSRSSVTISGTQTVLVTNCGAVAATVGADAAAASNRRRGQLGLGKVLGRAQKQLQDLSVSYLILPYD